MQPVGSTDNLPQIPEPDGSYMLNQKFVIPIYKKSAGICTCYSSHTSKALHCPLLSERATQKPHADMYIYLSLPYAKMHRYNEGLYKTYPQGIYRCHVLDRIRSLRSFYASKNKASSKRLSTIYVSPFQPPFL